MKVINKKPDCFEALYILGKSHERKKSLNNAIYYTEKAYGVKGTEMIKLFLGQLYAKNNQPKKSY